MIFRFRSRNPPPLFVIFFIYAYESYPLYPSPTPSVHSYNFPFPQLSLFQLLYCATPAAFRSYTPTRKLHSASDTGTFVILGINTKLFGRRSFFYTGPSVLNNLPRSVRRSDSFSSFTTALETHVFFKLFLTCLSFPQLFLSLWSVSGVCVCVCMYMCVFVCVCVCVCTDRCVSVAVAIVKCPVLPLHVEDGGCTNFLLLLLLILRSYCMESKCIRSRS